MQSCAGDNYAQAIVAADSVTWINSLGACDATALKLCKAMQKSWQIAGHNDDKEDGHNDDKEEDDDNDDDSEQLEKLLDAVMQKQNTIKKKGFNCNRKDHGSLQYCYKKKKGRSEKAGVVNETRVNKTKANCCHYRETGHGVSSCWKKYPHKAPSMSSTEASGVFLNKELLVCNINVNGTYCITENVENAYYCIPIKEDRQWDELSDWLELQEQAKTHDRQTKELAASQVEHQQWSVQAEASNSKWDPHEMEPNEQANKMVTRHHGPAYSHESEYGLGTKTMMASMTMLKRSDM